MPLTMLEICVLLRREAVSRVRGECPRTREIADLRIRVERLEKERGHLPQ